MFLYTASPEQQEHIWGPFPEDNPPVDAPEDAPEEEFWEEEEEEAVPV